MLYEWDYAAVTANKKSANSITPWKWNRKDFKLYHSADIHTKVKRAMPNFLWVLIALFIPAAYLLPAKTMDLYSRFSGNKKPSEIQTTVTTAKGDTLGLAKKDDKTNLTNTSFGNDNTPVINTIVYPLTDLAKVPKEFRPTGCIVKKNECQCYDDDGAKIEVELKQCLMATTEIRLIKTGRAQSGNYPTPNTNEVKNEPIPSAKIDNGMELNFPQKTVEQKYDKQAIGQNFLPVPAPVVSGGVLSRGS